MNTWIDGALIVDGTGADPRHTGVLIEAGRITRLGGQPRADTEVIDAAEMTLTPVLIDAHVHIGLSSPLEASRRHELSVAEIAADMFAPLDGGFTTVRDTGGIDGGINQVIATGKVRGPRVLQCGPQRDSRPHTAV